MKIALLLDREPFGEIFEETLSRHLGAESGRPQSVRWIESAPKLSDLLARKPGLWLCNPEINAVFSARARSQVFEVPWREYLGGASFLKVGAHAGYLTAATAPVGRWALATHHIWVEPEIENSRSKLILGGNTRLRMIDYDRGLVTTVLKSRFDPTSMSQELEFRQAREDVLAPPIVEVLEEGRAYVEPLIHGTNADRILSETRAEEALLRVLDVSLRLGRDTRRTEPLTDWVSATVEKCRISGERVRIDTGQAIEGAIDMASRLGDRVVAMAGSSVERVEVGSSHGDLQRGNVLVEDEKTWLIDWERVGTRILGYDGLTLALESRRRYGGLLARCKSLVEGVTTGAIRQRMIEEVDRYGDLSHKVRYLMTFLLEELRFHLEENAMGPLDKPTAALGDLVAELQTMEEDDFWNVG